MPKRKRHSKRKPRRSNFPLIAALIATGILYCLLRDPMPPEYGEIPTTGQAVTVERTLEEALSLPRSRDYRPRVVTLQ